VFRWANLPCHSECPDAYGVPRFFARAWRSSTEPLCNFSQLLTSDACGLVVSVQLRMGWPETGQFKALAARFD
jgi:hypothetical protein